MGDATLLEIEGLAVSVDGQEILSDIDLVVREGEVHVLLGPNGGGKTTLLNTIMGMPAYRVTRGAIRFGGRDILGLEIDERARLGIGMAFQRPPAVRGVKLAQLIEVARAERHSDTPIEGLTRNLKLEKLLDRDVNMAFSGGETKRSEMAQLLAQDPELTLFDEPESGVDLDNIAVVGEAMNSLLKDTSNDGKSPAGLIVTHTGHILRYVEADIGHVLLDGTLVCGGDPVELLADIERSGYQKCAECPKC